MARDSDSRRDDLIRADQLAGLEQLVCDQFWRFAKANNDLAEGRGDMGQGAVADALGIDPSLYSRQLARRKEPCQKLKTRITVDSAVLMQKGFPALARRYGFEVVPLEFPDPNSFSVAGLVQALNCEGMRQGARDRRPLGVLQYFCLNLLYANADWQKVIDRAATSPVANQLAGVILTKAEGLTKQIRYVLEDYRLAAVTNPVLPKAIDLKGLSDAWIEVWQQVFKCLTGEGPVP